MTAIEKTYTLLGCAKNGTRAEPIARIEAALSLVDVNERTQNDVQTLRREYVAVVRANGEGVEMCRGMTLCDKTSTFRIKSAHRVANLWILRLEDEIMDGEV